MGTVVRRISDLGADRYDGGGRSCFVCGRVSDFQETGSAVVGVTDSVIRMIVETSPFTGSVFAL